MYEHWRCFPDNMAILFFSNFKACSPFSFTLIEMYFRE